MFKKFALCAIILFSYTNASFSFTDKAIELADQSALAFINTLEKAIGSEHSWTMSQMLDWFTDEEGNNAHQIMADFYLDNLEKETPINYKEAFVELALLANTIAQNNINTRPYTKTALTKFIADNDRFINFVKNQVGVVSN